MNFSTLLYSLPSMPSLPSGFVFWVLCIEFFVLALVFWSNNNNKHYWGGFSLIVTLAILQFVAKIDIYTWVLNRWPDVLLYLGSHITLGTLWSMFKWFRFVRSELKEYRESKTRFLMQCGCNKTVYSSGTIPPALRSRWDQEIKGENISFINKSAYKYPPNVKDHKNMVVSWIVYWPVSVFYSMTHDLAAWFSTKTINLLKGIYNTMSNSIFREIIQDLEKEKKEEK